jgi:hypothetical protein
MPVKWGVLTRSEPCSILQGFWGCGGKVITCTRKQSAERVVVRAEFWNAPQRGRNVVALLPLESAAQ